MAAAKKKRAHAPTSNDEPSKNVRVGTVSKQVETSMRSALSGPVDPARRRRLTVVDGVPKRSVLEDHPEFADGDVRQVADSQGRGALQVQRLLGSEVENLAPHLKPDELVVKYVPLDSGALRVVQLSAAAFDARYTRLVELPVKMSAASFANHAKVHGATREVLGHLARYIEFTEEEANAANTKQQQIKEEFMARVALAKQRKGKPAPKVKSARSAAPKAKGEKKERKPTAAGYFQELIMGGTFTDDVIFKKVQDKFPQVDDKKRWYVSWYRNYLKKKGKNPPAAKEAKA